MIASTTRRPVRTALATALMLALAAGTASADGLIFVTDGGDPDPAGTTTCSLRQALNLATRWPMAGACAGRNGISNTVEMAPWLANHHLVLEHGQLEVRLIEGTAQVVVLRGHGLVIDAAQASRVLQYLSNQPPVMLQLEDVTITGGDAGSEGGGGIYKNTAGDLRLVRSRVTGNIALEGGGIWAVGGTDFFSNTTSRLLLIDSRVDGNTATVAGGGILLNNQGGHIVRSTIADNHVSGGSGAGLWLLWNQTYTFGYRDLHIWHSTISGNTNAERGPGFYDSGAAIYNLSQELDLQHVTISGNRGAAGAVMHMNPGNSTVSIADSIISGNTFNATTLALSPDFATMYEGPGPTMSASSSVLGSGTSNYFASGGNLFTDTPMLGALADNGGFTPTLRPLAGSPAIDFADDARCGALPPLYGTIDLSSGQRGVARPQGAHCDAGAVEVRQGSFTISANATGAGRIDASPLPTGAGSSGGIANCTSAGGTGCSAIFAGENDISTLTFTATPATGWHLAGWSGDCAASTLDGGALLVVDGARSCSAAFEIDTHTIGGVVQGLAGSGLSLLLNGADNLPIAADGHFEFPLELDYGSAYDVTIATQPTNPSQTCFIPHGSGVADHDVEDIAVICADGPIPVEVSVAIDDGATTALPGDTPTYVISVRNDGDATAYNVALSTSIAPAGALEGLSWTCAGACSPAGGAGDVALLLDLPAKSQATVQLHGTVAVFAGPTLEVAAEVVVPDWYADPAGAHAATDSNDNPILFRDGFDG